MYPSPPSRAPASVIWVRVLAWIQVGFMTFGAVLAIGLAAAASTALDDDDDLTRAFGTLGVLLGVVFAVFWLGLVLLVAVPALLLRTGRRSRKTGSLLTLAVVQLLFATVILFGAVATLTGDRPSDAFVPLLFMLYPAAIGVLALLPASRAWAAVDPRTPAAPNGPWSPYGPPAAPPHGPPPTW